MRLGQFYSLINGHLDLIIKEYSVNEKDVKSVVLVAHEARASVKQLSPLIEALLSSSCLLGNVQCLLADLRGHGNSSGHNYEEPHNAGNFN